jgi:type II secretory pathway pseudopilin PulG
MPYNYEQMKRVRSCEDGFTITELVTSLAMLAIISVSLLGLFTTLVRSATMAKRRAVASELATNQMEYLKSLPYDNLAVAGGSIYATSPLPAITSKTVNGVVYTVTTSINYIDDAYDGCASYPTQALKQLYCRNYPPPATAPATDTNPQDYKIAHVRVTDKSNVQLAEVDTQISARVSETASTTGALFVQVIDESGSPVSGASVTLVNTTVTPAVNLSDTADGNGYAIFYGLPPDSTGYDYRITAAKTSFSSLSTIVPSGSLQPTYPNQNVLTQQSSSVTLTIKRQGVPSLVVETTNTAGSPLGNARLYIKGGYKKYTDAANAEYYYDNLSPSDTRPTTDAGGFTSLSNLVPGNYIFCGNSGATSCTVSGTTYYLAAAVTYGGTDSFNPVTVPTYDAASPPSQTFDYGGTAYLQKVRLMLTTSSTFPRIHSLSPSEASIASGTLNNFSFTITGTNLPCNADPALCAATVSLVQGASTFPASCTGTSAGTDLSCNANLSTAVAGHTQLVVTSNSQTLTLPGSPLIGGPVVVP